MIVILSPAKTLDFDNQYDFEEYTISDFLDDSKLLINELKKISSKDLSKLMKLSSKLSDLNFERYINWNENFSLSNSCQAIFCFKGGVYIGLNVKEFSKNDLVYSQDYLRILSGLHGVLKPFDLIQPYRLEMGTRLTTHRGNNLYEFWGDKISYSLNESLKKNDSDYLLNLASNEYFSSVNINKIDAEIIDVKFLDKKGGEYKIISFFAKKARGSMASFVVKNKVKKIDDLKNFSNLGYEFDQSKSNDNTLVFIR
tara:strand:- start:1630 stop:2394 length:765 start_codon:yes stop_codon:yes gene_type:complete